MPSINHNNTWRSTVAKLVKRVDVVIMDLRGFSEQKEGCECEINYLVDHISMKQVVFLVNDKDKDNLALIRQTIQEQGMLQRPDSPNLEVEQTEIKLLIASDKEDEQDNEPLHIFMGMPACFSCKSRFLTACQPSGLRF